MKLAMRFPLGKWGLSLLLAAFLCFGCVSIPEVPYVVSGRGDAAVVTREAVCRNDPSGLSAVPGEGHRQGIDPGGFTLFSWNVMKEERDGWKEDFQRLAREADLLTLQEASLSETLREQMREGRYHWDLTAAFLYRSRETGVLTGSRIPPASLCVSRFSEPLAVIPKTSLVSRYPLAGTDRFLLVANVHLINFTFDTDRYREQLRILERTISSHEGPLLLAGDLNTWSGGRMEVVEGLTSRLGLRGVEFAEEDLASFFGRPVDHVFTRGLEAVDARVIKVSTSDHNPVVVRFRVPGRGGI
jgi:endonuclease/exonuclease/phosphatase (EEP) superfamily protein YafD